MLTNEEIEDAVEELMLDLLPKQEEIRLTSREEVKLESEIILILKTYFQGKEEE
jgi:hypothetical protein